MLHERREHQTGLRRFRPFDRRVRDRDIREDREATHIALTAEDIPRLSEVEREDEMRREGSRVHVCRVWVPTCPPPTWPAAFYERRADQLLPGDVIEYACAFGHFLEVAEVHITPTLVLLDFTGLSVGLNLPRDEVVRVP
jgi:hypothetical protein